MKKFAAVLFGSILSLTLSAADIFLTGDSTCASYPANRAPLTGWGQVLQTFCKDGCKVYNLARSGASTKTYLASKYYTKMLAEVKKGDFVVVQFGHNDANKNAKKHAAPGSTYDANLKKFITDVRAKGGIPIIASSISRASFTKDGKIAPGNLKKYRNAAFNVAKAENVAFVDLNTITAGCFNKLGQAETRKLFMCSTGIPKREKDTTHVNKAGAEVIAKLFVDAVKAQKLPVAECFK